MAVAVDQPGDEKELIAADPLGLRVAHQKVFVSADRFDPFSRNSDSAAMDDGLIMRRDEMSRSHQHGYSGHENSSLALKR
jgi:hypothetical protein